MGGGSGNAAGALIGLNRLYGEPLSRGALAALAGPLGAVPYSFLAERRCAPARATSLPLCDQCRTVRLSC